MSSSIARRVPFTKRGLALAIVLGSHVIVLYGLASGLAREVVQVVAPPIEVELTERIEEEPPPPPPPPPEFERPPVQIPQPDVTIQLPPEPTTALANVTDKPIAAPPPRPAPPAPPVSRIPPMLDVRRSPSTDEYYPPVSRRLGEEGGTVVDVCISADGRITGRPQLAQTSGSSRLDEAALNYAARTRWEPATENGRRIESCTSLKVRFELVR